MLGIRVTNYPAHGMMASHHHEEPSFIVVLSGGYWEQIQGSEVEHDRGHMLFYPAFATHSQRFGPGGARKLVFTPESSSLEYLRDHGMPVHTPHYVKTSVISQVAQRVLAEMEGSDTFTPLALNGILLELVAAFARKEQYEKRGAPFWVRVVRDFVHENANQNLSLEVIAQEVDKHPVHIAREFRRHFGLSIGGYQRQLRLQRAEAMLLHKNTELTEVALACGFANHSHLSRSFKAAYGMTPSQFRSRRA